MKRLLSLLACLVALATVLSAASLPAAAERPTTKRAHPKSTTSPTSTTSTTAPTSTTSTTAPTSTTSTTAPPPASPTIRLTRSGTELLLDGRPRRFVGVNAYQLATLWSVNRGCGGQVDDLDAFFSSLPPASLVRFWAFQELAVNRTSLQRDFTAIDRVVSAAARHGHLLVMTIGNHWRDCDGFEKTTAWYGGGFRDVPSVGDGLPRAAYVDYVREVATRYRTSPAIGMWEPVNEPELTCGRSDVLRSFFDAIGGEIKRIDPSHLISSGTIGGGQCGTQGAEYEYVHASPGIDVASFHDYGADTAPIPGDQWNGLAVRLEQTARLAKPLIVGEVGMVAGTAPDCPMSTSRRADLLAAKLDAQMSAGVRAFLPWAWTADPPACTYDIRADDPAMAWLRTVGASL